MNEMIERVARAICDASHCDGSVWDDAAEGFRELFRDEARAAIAALRSPTAAMTQAAADADAVSDNRSTYGYALAIDDAVVTWEAMIDEALKP